MSDYAEIVSDLRRITGGSAVTSVTARAADAIEALVKERDDLKREMHARELHHFEEEQKSSGLAAVIETVRSAVNDPKYGRDAEWVAMNVRGALSTAPADALREHDADVWDEGFDSGHYTSADESRDCGCRTNPYRQERESKDA